MAERLVEIERLAADLQDNPDARYAWATAVFGVRICEAVLGRIAEVLPLAPR